MNVTYPFCSSLSDDSQATKRKTHSHYSKAVPTSKRKKEVDKVDEMIISNLQELSKGRTCDEEEIFGKSVAATIRRFTLRQKAIAKNWIQGILLDIEFPE